MPVAILVWMHCCKPMETAAPHRKRPPRSEGSKRDTELWRLSTGERAIRLATAVALEQRFTAQAKGIEVTGRLDCALETEEGLELIDFKFTSSVPEDPDPLQLQLYAWGLKEVTGSTADTLTYYYLRQEQRVSFPGGDGAIQQGKELAIRTAEQLQEDYSFAPQVGPWCHTCSYQRYCPRQRENPDAIPPLLVQTRLPL